MFSAFKKSVVALLLGIVGLCAGPVGAQKPPRLLFLGVKGDGRAPQLAENAVQVRLEGLDVSVVKPKQALTRSCDRHDCLIASLTSEGADLVLTARILKNEHACLATLLLVTRNDQATPVEQDIACRSDGTDNELAANLADGAAAMVEANLRKTEIDTAKYKAFFQVNSGIVRRADHEIKKMWSWKKKLGVAGFTVLTSLGIIGISCFASFDKQPAQIEAMPCQANMTQSCPQIYSFGPQIALSSSLTAAATASLLLTLTLTK